MNGVSLLIYLVSVTSSLSLALGWALGISLILVLIFLIVTLSSAGESSDAMQKAHVWGLKYFKRMVWITIFVTLGIVFVPSRQDMIMIAASEVGEYVIQTEEMQGAVNEVSGLSKDSVTLLREYIKSETEALRAKTEKPVDGEQSK